MGCGSSKQANSGAACTSSYEDTPLQQLRDKAEDALVSEIREKRVDRQAARKRLEESRGAVGLQARGVLMFVYSTPESSFAQFLADCPEYANMPTFGANASNAIPGSTMLARAAELAEAVQRGGGDGGGGGGGGGVAPNTVLRGGALRDMVRLKAIWGRRLLAVTLLMVGHPVCGRMALVQPLLGAACMARLTNWAQQLDPVFETLLLAGASPRVRNSLNMTPLMLLATALANEVEKAVLTADSDQRLGGGFAEAARLAAVAARALLAAGADPRDTMVGFGARWAALGEREREAALPAVIRPAKEVLHLESYTAHTALQHMMAPHAALLAAAAPEVRDRLAEFEALLLVPPPPPPGPPAQAQGSEPAQGPGPQQGRGGLGPHRAGPTPPSGAAAAQPVDEGPVPDGAPGPPARDGGGASGDGDVTDVSKGGGSGGGDDRDGGGGGGGGDRRLEGCVAGREGQQQQPADPRGPAPERADGAPSSSSPPSPLSAAATAPAVAAAPQVSRGVTWPWVQAMSNIAWAVSQVSMAPTAGSRRELLRALVRQAPFELPGMAVLSGGQLRRAGRIPRYSTRPDPAPSEPSASPASSEAVGVEPFRPLPADALPPGSVVVFVSHRWLGRGCPDDEAGTKLKQVLTIADRVAALRGVSPDQVYLWLDYSVVDQSNPMPGVQALPIYIACCDEFVYVEHGEYWERAWCLTEQFMHWKLAVGEVKHALCPASLALRPESARQRPPDPTYGKLAVEADRVALATMTSIMPYDGDE